MTSELSKAPIDKYFRKNKIVNTKQSRQISISLSLSLYSKPRNNSKYRFTCNKIRPSFAKIYYNRTVLNFKQIVKIRRMYFPYGRYKTIGQKKRKKLFLYSANENTVEASLDRSSSKMNLSICLKASSGSAGFFIRRLTISRGNPLSREPIATVRLDRLACPPFSFLSRRIKSRLILRATGRYPTLCPTEEPLTSRTTKLTEDIFSAYAA